MPAWALRPEAMIQAVLLCLLGYFIVSSFVLGLIVWNDDSGTERVMKAGFSAALSPFLVVASLAVDLGKWLDAHAQVKTFWWYLFDRGRMVRDAQDLESMHAFTLKHKNTSSIEHRLWRLAERCWFKVNKYKP